MKGDDVSPQVMDEVVDVGVAVGALVLLNRTAVVLNARKDVTLAYGGRVVLNRGMPVELRNGADVVALASANGGLVALANGNRVLLEKGAPVEWNNGAEVVALASANGGLVVFKDGTLVTLASVAGAVEFMKGARVALVDGKLVVFMKGAGVVAFEKGADVELSFAVVLGARNADTLVDEFEKDTVLEALKTAGFVVFRKRPLLARLTDVCKLVVFDLALVLLAKRGAEVVVAFANGALLVVLKGLVLEPGPVGNRGLEEDAVNGPPLEPTTLPLFTFLADVVAVAPKAPVVSVCPGRTDETKALAESLKLANELRNEVAAERDVLPERVEFPAAVVELPNRAAVELWKTADVLLRGTGNLGAVLTVLKAVAIPVSCSVTVLVVSGASAVVVVCSYPMHEQTDDKAFTEPHGAA